MLSNWELFEKTSVGRMSRTMRVSLNERGTFTLNKKAWDELREPKFVQLFFDRVNSLIGVKPCAADAPNGYDVKQQGDNRSWLVRSMAFCTYYNIQVTGTVVFTEPKIEDGMLVLSLKAVTQIAKRKKATTDAQQPTLAAVN